MSELEARLREAIKVKEPERGSDRKRPTLAEALESNDADLAEDVMRERARLERARIERERRDIEDRNLRAQGGGTPVTQIADPTVEVQKKIVDQCVYLLNQGVDPKVVGQLLQGMPTNAGSALLPGSTSQGASIKDLTSAMRDMFEMVETRKPKDDGGLTRVLDRLDRFTDDLKGLREEVADVKAGRYARQENVSPADALKQQIDLLKTAREMATEMGWVKQEATATGEPIDIVREKNRHAEKMKEIDVDSEHKERIGNIIAEIPERIGKGITSQLMTEGGEESGTGGLPTYPCTCGHKIVIPPGAPDAIKCSKCGAVYTKGEKPPEQALKPDTKAEAKKES